MPLRFHEIYTVCMNLPVCLVRMKIPFVIAVDDVHHLAVIELRFDVYDDVSALSRPRSICHSLLKYMFGYVVLSSQTT